MTEVTKPKMIPLVDGALLAHRGYHELRELMLRGRVRGERGERGKLYVAQEDCERLRSEGDAKTVGA